MQRSIPIVAVLLAAVTLAGGGAQAAECPDWQTPSPASETVGSLTFHNSTPFAARAMWSDFEGVLKDYGLIQPGEDLPLQSFDGHRWIAEVYTPDGAVCVGSWVVEAGDGCFVDLIESDGAIGSDTGGSCSFEP